MPPGGHSSHSHSSFSSHSGGFGPSRVSHSSHSGGFGPSRVSHSSHSGGFGPSRTSHSGHSGDFGPFGGPMGHGPSYRPPIYYSRPPRVRVMPIYVSSGSTYRSAQPAQAARQEENPIRDRVNQPQGYNQTLPDYKEPSFYHCRKHDYIYYPIGWYDSETGEFRGAGYYDENGAYYPNAVIYTGTEYEAAAFCMQCSQMVQPESKTAGIWYCPVCKTQITDMIEDVEIQPVKKKGKGGLIGMSIMLAVGIAAVSMIGGTLDKNRHISDYNGNTQRITTQSVNHQSSYYVTELGRECQWIDEFNSYYDSQTDCYFWYNDEIEKPQWQYWYEGISSDYSDSGWMEYDQQKHCWYIETKSGKWEKLPASYDTSRLWHIDN